MQSLTFSEKYQKPLNRVDDAVTEANATAELEM